MTCDNCEYKHICNKHRVYDAYNDKVIFIEYTDETCDGFKAENSCNSKEYAEVIHAYWKHIRDEQAFYNFENWNYYRCSHCNYKSDANYNYCPKCGAKMDKDP